MAPAGTSGSARFCCLVEVVDGAPDHTSPPPGGFPGTLGFVWRVDSEAHRDVRGAVLVDHLPS
eukprot:10417522-Lingulodinium_polyedra.AAC.1